MRSPSSHYILTAMMVIIFSGCRHDKFYDLPGNIHSRYPEEIDAIISDKCASSGCHNSNSSNGAGGLDLTDIDQLYNGSINGAVVIPYRPDLSSLLYFTNVDSNLGPIQQPTMPVNASHLSQEEYLKLRNWILTGAPDKDGKTPFTSNPLRKKIYVVNEGCDLLAVFDQHSGVIMRYYNLGVQPNIKESPGCIRVTPDNKYFLVSFLNADFVQMFSTETDQLLATIPIGNGMSGDWSSIFVAADSKQAFIIDYLSGCVAIIDLISKTAITTPGFAATLKGIAMNSTQDTLLIAEDQGSRIFKMPLNNFNTCVSNDISTCLPNTPVLKINDIAFTPDNSKYIITCANINQVWIFDASKNTLIDTFRVREKPQQIAVSQSTDYFFVTCSSGNAVEVFNYQTMLYVKSIAVGENPYGLVVDDAKGKVYVLNRGGHGHHPSICEGLNGNMQTIDLHSLKKEPGLSELSVNPLQISSMK